MSQSMGSWLKRTQTKMYPAKKSKRTQSPSQNVPTQSRIIPYCSLCNPYVNVNPAEQAERLSSEYV